MKCWEGKVVAKYEEKLILGLSENSAAAYITFEKFAGSTILRYF